MAVIEGNKAVSKWLKTEAYRWEKERTRNLADKLFKRGWIHQESKEEILRMTESLDPEVINLAWEILKGIRRSYNKKFKWR